MDDPKIGVYQIMKKKIVRVTKESDTGLNQMFYNPEKGRSMTRNEFADKIEKGVYEGYHIMHMNSKRIPRSNPDDKTGNNLD